jgi:hypothetical protein
MAGDPGAGCLQDQTRRERSQPVHASGEAAICYPGASLVISGPAPGASRGLDATVKRLQATGVRAKLAVQALAAVETADAAFFPATPHSAALLAVLRALVPGRVHDPAGFETAHSRFRMGIRFRLVIARVNALLAG